MFKMDLKKAEEREVKLQMSIGSSTPEVRGGGREEQPHVQGVAAVWAQKGREELLHVEGPEGRL